MHASQAAMLLQVMKRPTMLWKPLIAVVVLLIAAASAIGYWWTWRGDPNELVFPGTVEVQEVRLSSKIGGRIEQLFIAEGQMAEPGQKIVQIAVPELEAQRLQVQAQLAAAEATLQKLIAGPRPEEKAASAANLRAMQARRALVVAGNRKEEVEKARADVESLDAQFQVAVQDLNRERSLLAKGATSQANYDSANARYGRLQAELEAARANYELIEKGSRIEEIAEAEAQLAQAEANNALLLAGTRKEDIDVAQAQVRQLQGKLRELEVNLSEAVVIAPERAIVEVLSVRPGDTVAPNQPVARILRADDMWVKAFVPETELGRVKVGQQVTVTMDTFPSRRFAGVVFQIATSSEFTPRNVATVDERHNQVFGIKVHVDDPQGIFKSGMAADVHVRKDAHAGK